MGMLTKLLLVMITLGGGGFIWMRMQAQEAVHAPQVAEVRVASKPLQVGVFLSDSNAPFTEIPIADLRPGHLRRDSDAAVGAVVIATVAEGQPITSRALLMPGQEGFLAAVLRPEMRAVSLAVDAVSSNAGHIFPGDRVDVLLTQHLDSEVVGDDPWRAWASETILDNVRVIAVDQNLHSDLTQRDPVNVARTITLEVGPRDAERLAVARNLGAISLTLRSLIVDETPAAETLDAPEKDKEPTWAGDFSAVSRATAKKPEMEPDEPLPPPMRTLRGGKKEVVTQ